MNKFVEDIKYQLSLVFSKPITKSFTPDTRSENMVFLGEVCPWIESKKLYLALLLIILDGRVK